MLDDLSPETPREVRKDAPQRGRKKDQEVRSIVEREVPLGQHEDHVLAPAVHSWLDGELPEAAVRKGNTAHDVEFWRNVNNQMERARRMRTPQHVEAQIMAALPHHAPALITPWWRREFVVTPMTAVSVAAALVTVAVVATVLFIAP
jgi:hypothetical protein